MISIQKARLYSAHIRITLRVIRYVLLATFSTLYHSDISLSASSLTRTQFENLQSKEIKKSPKPEHCLSDEESSTKPLLLHTNIPTSCIRVTDQAIYIDKALQSREKQLFIEARGDIYLSKLITSGDLVVSTTGHVYLQDDIRAEGSVTVKGNALTVYARCKAKGQAQLLAETSIEILGSVSSKKILQLISVGEINLTGRVKGKEGLVVLAGSLLTHSGNISSRGEIVIRAKAYTQSGTLIGQQLAEITIEEDLILADSSTIGVRQLSLKSKQKNVHFLGDVFSEEKIRIAALEDVLLRGNLTSKNFITASCKNFLLKGSFVADKGAFLTVAQLWNIEGSCTVHGAGLQATVGHLENKGHLDTKGLSLILEAGNNYGSIHTRGHYTLKATKYANHAGSYTFTMGVHHIECADVYSDAGALHTPTLFLAQARTLKFLTGHHAYLKDALLSSTVQIMVGEGVHFDLFGPRVFLQLSSNGSVAFRGTVHHDSIAKYPFYRYHRSFNDQSGAQEGVFSPSNAPHDDIMRSEADQLGKNHPWSQRGLGMTIQAHGDVTYAGTSRLDGGALSVTAGGKVHVAQGMLQAGYFKGDSVSIQAAQMSLDQATIKTYFDNVFLGSSGALTFKKTDLSSGMSTILKALSIDVENSSLVSLQGYTHIEAKKAALFKEANLHSRSQNSIQAGEIGFTGVTLSGETTALIAENALRLYESTIRAQHSMMNADTVEAEALSLEGDASINTRGTIALRNVTTTGTLATRSDGETSFEGTGRARHLVVHGEKIVNNAELVGEDGVQFVAGTVAQNRSITGGTVVIQADEYTDTDSSQTRAHKKLDLRVERGTGFKGMLHGDTVTITMDDFHLAALKRVIAHVTQLHIRKDVVIDKELVLNNTLHLWANKLTNNAQITARGDFIVQTSADILLGGAIDIKGTGAFIGGTISSVGGSLTGEKLYLQAKTGDVSLYQSVITAITDVRIAAEKASIKKAASKLVSGGDVSLYAAKNLEAQSLVAPGNSNNSDDQVLEDTVSARGNLTIETGQHLLMTAVAHKAEGNVTYNVGGTIRDASLKVESDRSEVSVNSSSSARRVFQQVSLHTAGATFSSRAGGDQDLSAPVIEAQKAQIAAAGKVTAREVHDIVHSQSDETHTGGFWGEDRQKRHFKFEAISKGLKVSARETAEIEGGGDVTLTNASVKAPRISLTSIGAAVRLLSGKNQSDSSTSEKSSNLAWRKQNSRVEHHKTYSTTSLEGALEIKSKQLFVEATKEQMQTLVRQIEAQGITALYNALEEFHNVDIKSSQGPSPALAAVVVVAVSICTAGTGAALGAAAAGSIGATGALSTVVATMTASAFTSLCCQATLALLANEGNIIKAAESLASTKTLENIGIAMVTAGATAGASDLLHIPSASQAKTALEQIERQVLQSSFSTTAAIAQGRRPEEAFVQGLKGAAAGAIGAVATTEIGEAYLHHDIDFFGHKVLHALVGGSTGALISDDLAEGFAAGAFGAVTAEMLGELILMNCHKIAGDVAEQLHEKDIPLTQENIRQAVREEITGKTDFIKLLTSGIAMLAGQDVSVASFSAAIALDNNLSNMACTITELDLNDILRAQHSDLSQIALPLEVSQPFQSDSQAQDTSETLATEETMLDDHLEPSLAYEVLETVATAGASGVANILARGTAKLGKIAATKIGVALEKRAAAAAAQKAESSVAQEVAHHTHFRPAEPNAANRAQFLEYQKNLARTEAPETIAVHKSNPAIKEPGVSELRVADKLAAKHKLPAEGFEKKVTSGHTLPDGEHIEPHFYSHPERPGEMIDAKPKLPDITTKNADGSWKGDRLAPWTTLQSLDLKK